MFSRANEEDEPVVVAAVVAEVDEVEVEDGMHLDLEDEDILSELFALEVPLLLPLAEGVKYVEGRLLE